MKYLFSLFTGLGNAIQKTPLISAVHAIDTNANVDIIGDNRFGALEIFKKSKLISSVHRISHKHTPIDILRFIEVLNSAHYDVVFLLADATPRWLRYMVYLSNAQHVYQHIWVYRIRLRDRIELLLKPSKVTLIPLIAGRHEIDMALDMLEAHIGKPFKRDRNTWVAIENDHAVFDRFKFPRNYICLQVGAANGFKTPKRWQLENFSKLIVYFQGKYPGWGIVTVGDRGDYDLIIKFLVEKHPDLINTAGYTSIVEVASILAMSRLLVCHDSGMMHLANAMNVPLIALYGPTDHHRTSPLGDKSIVVKKDIACAPCMYNYGISESAAFVRCPYSACMDAISPVDVMNEIEQVLLNRS